MAGAFWLDTGKVDQARTTRMVRMVAPSDALTTRYKKRSNSSETSWRCAWFCGLKRTTQGCANLRACSGMRELFMCAHRPVLADGQELEEGQPRPGQGGQRGDAVVVQPQLPQHHVVRQGRRLWRGRRLRQDDSEPPSKASAAGLVHQANRNFILLTRRSRVACLYLV